MMVIHVQCDHCLTEAYYGLDGDELPDGWINIATGEPLGDVEDELGESHLCPACAVKTVECPECGSLVKMGDKCFCGWEMVFTAN